MQRSSTIAILALMAATLIGATGCTAPAKTARPRTFGGGGEESGEPLTIVYLIDGGEYMMGSIGALKYELKRCIGELGDKKFQVIFYGASTTEIPGSEPVPATDKNKQEAFRLIDDYVPGDGADPTVGLERAFACRPDMIYFLAGAELPSSLIELVKRLNVNKKRTSVYTIRFLWRLGDDAVLRKIAEDNHGNYKFVTEDDLDEFIRREYVW